MHNNTEFNESGFYNEAAERLFAQFGGTNAYRMYRDTNAYILAHLARPHHTRITRELDRRLLTHLGYALHWWLGSNWEQNPLEVVRSSVRHELGSEWERFEKLTYERFCNLCNEDPDYVRQQMVFTENRITSFATMAHAYEQQLVALRSVRRITLKQLVQMYRKYEIGQWAFDDLHGKFIDMNLTAADKRRLKQLARALRPY